MYEYVSRHYIELLQDLLTMVKQSQDDYPHRSESNDHLAPGRFSVIWAAAVGHGFSVGLAQGATAKQGARCVY